MSVRIACVVALVALAATAAGCTIGAATPPSEDPSIRGNITTLTAADDYGSALVECVGKPLFDYDKASVRIDSDTKLLRQTNNGTYEEIAFADLAVGQEVDVWFVGAVAESYPVQATAGTAVVRQ